MRYLPAVAIGRVVRLLARLRKRGGGAAFPGLVVNAIAPRFLERTLKSFPLGVVVVTGTAGKSTTTRLLAAFVREHGLRVFTNPSTANIAQGLTSSVIASSSLTGRIDADIAILEMDEGHAAKLSESIPPRLSVLLNVCIDQIDRFFDPELVTGMLTRVANATTEVIVVNQDDDSCRRACANASASQRTFGMSNELFASAGVQMGYVAPRSAETSVDSTDCVLTGARGEVADILVGSKSYSVRLPSPGLHYGMDVTAAIVACQYLLGDAFDMSCVVRVLEKADPVFGRGETVSVGGEDINFVLVQNPVSYQLNVAMIPEGTEQVLVAIGSDVRDYSYLWGAHISGMPAITIATGPRCRDVALHALFSGVDVHTIEPDLERALETFLALPAPQRGIKTIIFSADSMRRIRSLLKLPEQEVVAL